jgi:uridine phosphorylase
MIMAEDEPLFTAKDWIRYEAKCRGVDESFFSVPSKMILVYQRFGFDYLKEVLNGESREWLYRDRPIFIAELEGKRVGVFRPWIGAPGAAAMLEELIACGAREVIEVGFAGGLQSSLEVGDIVVVTHAFRDEGTSYHYFHPDVKLESSANLRELLIQELKFQGIKFMVGPVWTTDGFYRETRSKFLKFRKQGALAVDGETSALFAVAKYRQINIASAQVISDILTEDGWLCAFRDEKVYDSLKKLLKAVVNALKRV